MKVVTCEAYFNFLIEKSNDNEVQPVFILQYKLGDSTKFPTKALAKIDQMIQGKVNACKMGILPRLGLDWLTK